MKVCPTCGKTFRTVPSYNQTFCSVRCYRAHTGETEPERNARICLEAIGIGFLQEHAFNGWRYPVDFYLPGIDTVLEIDGTYWHRQKTVRDRDARKTLWLQSRGHTVVRLPDTGFYGNVTQGMIDYLRAALNLAEHVITQTDLASLYPIQLALPLNK